MSAAEALRPTPAARCTYERALLELAQRGRVIGAKLSPLQFRVLCFLLAKGPGYVVHQKTIAAELECGRLSVWRALDALKKLGMVLVEVIPGHHKLPWKHRDGRQAYARNKVLRYWCRVERLVSSEPSGCITSEPSTGSTRISETTPPPTPSRRASSDAEGRRAAGETPTFAGDRVPVARGGASDARREHRGRAEHEARHGEHVSAEQLAALAAAWTALGLRDARGAPSVAGARERAAWMARMREGCSHHELADAIAGAGTDEWLRKGRARNGPFGVVFANVASIGRFAHEGRRQPPAVPRSTADLEQDAVRRRQQQLEAAAAWAREHGES